MLLSEHKNLKLEIKSLPEKEKDKLLLRLIAKDKVLTEHLHYKLLENEDDLRERYEILRAAIDEQIYELLKSRKLTSKEVLLKMRRLNGAIAHHYKVTRDIQTELDLRIHLLSQIPIAFSESVFSTAYRFNEKLFIYVVKSAVSLLAKYTKLHEDIQFDLKEELNVVLNKLYNHKTADIAKELGLPKEL